MGWASESGDVNSPDEDFATRYRAGLWDCVWSALEKEGRGTEQYKRCQWDLTLKQLRTIVKQLRLRKGKHSFVKILCVTLSFFAINS